MLVEKHLPRPVVSGETQNSTSTIPAAKARIGAGRLIPWMGTSLRLSLAVAGTALALAAACAPAMAAPVNDDFASASALAGDRGMADFDLSDSTIEAGEPDVSGSDGLSVWFRYSPSASGIARFAICRRDPGLEMTSPGLGVYGGGAVAALTPVAQSTSGCPAGEVNAELGSVAVTAGSDYMVRVSAASASVILGGTLTYDFNTAAPANDEFASAQQITGSLPQTIDADNGLATRETGEPGLEDWGPENSLWYRWTPAAGGTVSIDTCTTPNDDPLMAVDSRISVFTDSTDPADLAGLSVQATGDDGCAQPNGLLTHLYMSVAAGTEYWIRLANYSGENGHAYKLRLRMVSAPETTAPPYIYPNDPELLEGQTLDGNAYAWAADPAITSLTVQWMRCDGAGAACVEIPGETGSSYVAGPADVGHRLVFRVTGDNGVTSTAADSAPTAVVQTPPVDGGGGGGTGEAPPPAPADPFPALTLPKSLGKLKLKKKNAIALTKLAVRCGAAASGPCTGTLTITTAKSKAKKSGKTLKPVKQTFKLSVPAGAAMPTSFKLSSRAAAAVKQAGRLKAAIAVSLGAPGFTRKSASTSATLTAR